MLDETNDSPELKVVRHLIRTARTLRANRTTPEFSFEAAHWEMELIKRERELLKEAEEVA